MLALGADAAQTGYLQTAQTLPFLLLSLPAGVLADRMQRRLLMSAAECARAVSLLCLLALLWSGQLTLPLLAALGFLGAVGTVAYNVAAPRWCPGWCPGRIGRRQPLAGTGAQRRLSAGPAAGGAGQRAGRVRRLCAGDCAVAAGRPAAGGPAGRRARRDGGTPPSDAS